MSPQSFDEREPPGEATDPAPIPEPQPQLQAESTPRAGGLVGVAAVLGMAAIGALSWGAKKTDDLGASQLHQMEAAFAASRAQVLPVDLSSAEAQARAVAAAPLSASDARALVADAVAGRKVLVKVVLWDNMDEDGDQVGVTSGGVTAVVKLTHAPQTIVLPLGPAGEVILTGLVDGLGGGVTVGAETAYGPIGIPPMQVGETRILHR
jgi:hypothetical protein